MSKIKRALPEDVDVTPEGLQRIGDDAVLIDMDTFQREYKPTQGEEEADDDDDDSDNTDEDTEDWANAEAESYADMRAAADEDSFQQDGRN